MGVAQYEMNKEDIFSAISNALSSGLLYGVVMTIFLAYSHTKAVRNIPNSTDEDIVKSRQIRAVYVQINSQQAIDICLEALKEIEAELIKNAGDNNILGRTGISWNSFGENISLRITGNGYRSSITIVSNSRFGIDGVGVDHGKNLINVNRLEKFILREASKLPANLASGENTEFLSATTFENRSFDSARI